MLVAVVDAGGVTLSGGGSCRGVRLVAAAARAADGGDVRTARPCAAAHGAPRCGCLLDTPLPARACWCHQLCGLLAHNSTCAKQQQQSRVCAAGRGDIGVGGAAQTFVRAAGTQAVLRTGCWWGGLGCMLPG
jgi:hypothetical protein